MSRGGSRRQFLARATGVSAALASAAIGAISIDQGERATNLFASDAASLFPSDAAEPTSPTDADVGFCADMTVHHVQALAMCQRVLGRPTGDPVQAAAAEVLQTQAIEVGMMRAWLADWGMSTASPERSMGWMGMHDGHGMLTTMMPGLATDEEMRHLAVAGGSEQGRLWLELMRAHHVGGVAMATAGAELASAAKVRRLASVQVRVQTYEIDQYDQLLATSYSR